MTFRDKLGLAQIVRAFPLRVGVTWLLVLVEVAFLAFIPLLIGLAIDGLLAGRLRELMWFGLALAALTVVLAPDAVAEGTQARQRATTEWPVAPMRRMEDRVRTSGRGTTGPLRGFGHPADRHDRENGVTWSP